MSSNKLITITDTLVERGKSAAGGFSKAQLSLLGIAWPPAAGWKKQIIGQQITEEAAAQFISNTQK